ncbi:MAG: hypothetical protein QM775_13985 [Pirellulales bacterium]
MTSREAALIGVRTAAVYLFTVAAYWFIAALFLGVGWARREPELFETYPMHAVGALMALAMMVQAWGLGYWLWIDASQVTRPLTTRPELQAYADCVCPFLVLATAVWGALRAVPAVGDVVRAWHALYWYQSQRSSTFDFEMILQQVAALEPTEMQQFAVGPTVDYFTAVAMVVLARPLTTLLINGMPNPAGTADVVSSPTPAL